MTRDEALNKAIEYAKDAEESVGKPFYNEKVANLYLNFSRTWSEIAKLL